MRQKHLKFIKINCSFDFYLSLQTYYYANFAL